MGYNYPEWQLTGWKFSWCQLSWMRSFGWELDRVEIFFGGSFPGRNCPIGIIRVPIFREGVFMLPKNHFSISCKSSVYTAWKSVQIWWLFWSLFRKIRTRKNPVFGHFSRSVIFVTRYNLIICLSSIIKDTIMQSKWCQNLKTP